MRGPLGSYEDFPFEATKEALAYLETGRAKGKVVIKVR
jgi:NADPH:quinone reductase-like Zn-dependent oxidoreductase